LLNEVLLALGVVLAPGCLAADSDPAAWFEAGVLRYEAQDFTAAAERFEAAARAAPANDTYALWLGKTYGRLAERASWLQALRYARRARETLERAVSLNPTNPDALAALARFYAEAPAFLGGDKAKAEALRGRAAAADARRAAEIRREHPG
jgi:tetratricopeptide (TPR) repeat protein